MSAPERTEFDGCIGRIALHVWQRATPRYVTLIAHGYGEHAGRYQHVADKLLDHGAAVYAPDHLGHGQSEGERVLIKRFDDLVTDLYSAAQIARSRHPNLPLILIGHSLGGLVASRYTQVHGTDLNALVLSAPALGADPSLAQSLELERIPEVPIDPAVLSRDPEVGRAYEADPLVWHGPFKRATIEALLSAINDVATGPTLAAIPTLWIHGEADQLTPLERTRKAIELIRGERLESIIYPEARHELFNETNREDVLAAVVSFLDRAIEP